MERLRLKYQDAFNALKTLEDILKEPFSMIIRDATSSALNILLKHYGSS